MKVATGKLTIKKSNWNALSLLFFLYAIMPLVDTINGFVILQLNMSSGVGQIYRFAVIILMWFIVLSGKCDKRNFFSTICILVLCFFLIIIRVEGLDSIGAEFSLVMQWLLVPLLLFGFLELKRRGYFSREIIDKILYIYAWLLPVTIIVPRLLGVGFHTYAGGVGYKGFYYSNNGVAFLAAVLVIFSFYNFLNNISVVNAVQAGVLFITCLTLGTKASVIAIGVALVFAIVASFQKSKARGITNTAILFSGVAIIIFCFRGYIFGKINAVIARYQIMGSIYVNRFLDRITSGRTLKVEELWKMMISSSKYSLNLFVGMGNTDMVAEIDILDLFFSFGIIGVIIALVYGIELIRKLNFDVGIYKGLLIFSFAYSIVVGHVFNNSMSSMVFVLIVASATLKPIKKNRG